MLRELSGALLSSRLNVLLLLVPVAIVLDLAHVGSLAIFVAAALAIVPLAGLIGHATEDVSIHAGPGIGGFLNATFGNATELIIALLALHAGLQEVVKASITGSILGNLLLVLGVSMFAGGYSRHRQQFNRTAAGTSAAMLAIAAGALIMPDIFQLSLFGSLNAPDPQIKSLSLLVAIVLMLTYVASLWFSLRTHSDLFGPAGHAEAEPPRMSMQGGLVLLGVATLVTALVSEILVGSLEAATHQLGLTQFFVGAIVVAVVGNAAEHSSAVAAALRNKMDLSVTIAIGSATQIALLVAPVLVVASFLIGQPMTLVFREIEIAAIFLSVVVVSIVLLDGESTWFEGLQLVALYLILAVVFFFVPESVLAPAHQ